MSEARHSAVPPIAVTMGEPSGIGAEISLAAWQAHHDRGLPPFFMIDDPERLAHSAQRVGLEVPIETIAEPAEALTVFARALPVLALAQSVSVLPGDEPEPQTAQAVVDSIRTAVALVMKEQAAAVVTNPIRKQSLSEADYAHPGHTELLAELAGCKDAPIMMLAGPELRVVPVTIHVPLSEVAGALTKQAIIHACRVTAEALRRDFGLAEPRLAVAALNPHAGENGTLGREEIDIIAPAVEAAAAEGIALRGPLPADTLFHVKARGEQDAVICMYHDQALIPLKTLDFERGVNITLGLPFVRTSPDHGTARDIAGRGVASPESLISAIATAQRMARARAQAKARAA